MGCRMKIEKVNENQIRCTLTKEDLASRQLKISELAYGTEKAKNLFRDMMQQANFEFGFEADDIPLMIEAIPMNAECIVLIITKVEDPEELDTRFSRFAPSVHEEDDQEDAEIEPMKEDVMDLFKKIQTAADAPGLDAAGTTDAAATAEAPKQLIRLFQFDSLHPLINLSSRLAGNYTGASTLYRESRNHKYLLLISHSSTGAEQFNRLCNIASEYSTLKKVLPSTPSYLEEHCTVIIPARALQILANVNK